MFTFKEILKLKSVLTKIFFVGLPRNLAGVFQRAL